MKNNNRNDHPQFRLNWLKWCIILALLVGGVYANYHFSQVVWSLRAVGWIVLVAVLLAIASQTMQGFRAWAFVKSSRVELRKVVWPTRKETLQTTLIVIVMVIATAIILWGLDSLLMWLVGLLTGQRG